MKPISNPPNPFTSYDCHYFDDLTPPATLEVYEDLTRTILSKNDSPDLGFRYSLNPYRGCTHSCIYCYARPSHEYLGFGAGSDFDTKIVIKLKAAELLREAFMKPSWKGESIMFSGETDCYQPIEASYRLTRQCLEVCYEFGNPVSIITKSFLILRDEELLVALHKRTRLWVTVSIPFFDEKIARLIEPNASAVANRFEIVRRLSQRGISTSVNIAPIIPGLNDSQIPQILRRAKECGAKSAAPVLLRLPGSVKDVFVTRLQKTYPLAYEKIIGRIKEVRGGKLYNSEFGKRHHGEGPYWQSIEQMFEVQCEKLGLNQFDEEREARPPFKRPSKQAEFAF